MDKETGSITKGARRAAVVCAASLALASSLGLAGCLGSQAGTAEKPGAPAVQKTPEAPAAQPAQSAQTAAPAAATPEPKPTKAPDTAQSPAQSAAQADQSSQGQQGASKPRAEKPKKRTTGTATASSGGQSQGASNTVADASGSGEESFWDRIVKGIGGWEWSFGGTDETPSAAGDAPVTVAIPDPAPKPDPQPAPAPQPQPDPKPEPAPQPGPKPQPQPQPGPKPQPQPDPKPEPQPQPQPDPKPEPQPQPQPDPKPEPAPEPAPVAPEKLAFNLKSVAAPLKSNVPSGSALPYRMLYAELNADEDPATSLAKVAEAYQGIDPATAVLITPFSDKTKALIVVSSDANLVDAKSGKAVTLEDADLSSLTPDEGVYAAGADANVAEKTDAQDLSAFKLAFVSGAVSKTEKLAIPPVLIGGPNNTLNCGVVAPANASLVMGVNFVVQETAAEALTYGSVLQQNDKTQNDLWIVGNTFDFGTGAKAAYRGVYVRGVGMGALRVYDNVFKGTNPGPEYPPTSSAVLDMGERPASGTSTELVGNLFDGCVFAGVNLKGNDDASLVVLGNTFKNLGQDALVYSIFGNPLDVTIKDNVFESWGRREVIRKRFGATGGTETSEFETAINLSHIDQVYGVRMNGEWFNDATALKAKLIADNDITAKAENDKHEHVLDSVEVSLRTRSFNDPHASLNNRYSSSMKKTRVTLVKNEDGDLTIGQDPDAPTREIEVKDLYIMGTGTGRIVLAPTLKVTGKLVIDLPHGFLVNQSPNKQVEIVNIQGQDKTSGRFDAGEGNWTINRGAAPAEGLSFRLVDVKNAEGAAVGPEKTALLSNLKIVVFGETLDQSHYTVDDATDTVTLKPDYLNTLKAKATFEFTFEQPDIKVGLLTGSKSLLVNDLTSFEATPTSELTFYDGNAPDEGLKVKIANVTGMGGQSLSAEQTTLAGHVKVGVGSLDDYQATPEDLEFDDSTDTLTLKKSYLDRLPATETVRGPEPFALNKMRITVENPEAGIGTASKELTFACRNLSNAEFEWTGPETFTKGSAPREGISLRVTNLTNAKGEKVSPTQVALKSVVNIEPFPASYGSEIVSTPNGPRFDPKHYTFDDATDTFTLKASYLNTLTISDRDTEFGRKEFVFTIRSSDGSRFNVRSPKMLLHIKKVEAAPSTDATISSSELTVDDQGALISSGTAALSETMSVSELRTLLAKKNPRQQIRVFTAEEAAKDPLVLTNYKNDYENVESTDKVVVIAEDGYTTKTYALAMDDLAFESLVTSFGDPVVKLERSYAVVDGSKPRTVGNVEDALMTQMGAFIKIYKAPEVIELSKIQAGADLGTALEYGDALPDTAILEVKKDEKVERRVLVVSSAPAYRALLIGNSNYGTPEANLAGPPNDLNLMRNIFGISRFANDAQAQVTSRENLTKEQMVSAIKEAFKDARPSDVSYLYYSGHGNSVNQVSYLCSVYPDDVRPSSAEEAVKYWLSVDELHEALKSVPGTKVVILDCCNAGGFIGKAFADAESGATVHGHGPGDLDAHGSATASDRPEATPAEHEAFVSHVQETFAEESIVSRDEHAADDGHGHGARDASTERALKYLTEPEFKILTASSANEYSFEDKKKAIGKFTQQLAQSVGIRDGEPMAGDIDGNNKLSLHEAYVYLTNHVAATSHIQAFPRMDNFTLFSKTGASAALSGNLEFSSKALNGKPALRVVLRKKGNQVTGGIVTNGSYTPSVEDTVEKILGFLEPGVPGQRFYILPKGVDATPENAKRKDEKLVRLDRVLVVAPSGASIALPLVVASESAPPVPPAASGPDFGDAYVINTAFRSIGSGTVKLRTSTTVSEFLAHLKNRAAYGNIEVSGGPYGAVKRGSDRIGDEARVKFYPLNGGSPDIYTLNPGR